MASGQILTCKRVLAEISNVTPPLSPWRQSIIDVCKNRAVDEADTDVQRVFARDG